VFLKEPSLAQRTLEGGIITLIAQGIIFLGQIVTLAVLARKVSPSDFGLIGLFAAMTAFLNLFRDMGIATAIIQRPSLLKNEINTFFYISILLGFLVGILVYASGFLVAWFFKAPEILEISPWYGLAFFCNSVASVPIGWLRRQMKFGGIALRDVIAFLLSSGAGVLAASLGAGYWALVIMAVSQSFFGMLVIWLASDWRPGTEIVKPAQIFPLFKFGGAITASEIANYLSQNLDSVLIGKIWGLQQLGYYNRAYALIMIPLNQIMGPVGSVLIPALSRLQEEPEHYEKRVGTMFNAVMLGIAPFCAFLFVAAAEIIALLLGPAWSMSHEIFLWFLPALYSRPAGSILYWVMLTSGRGYNLLKWTWINTTLTMTLVVAAVHWGPVAVAASYSVSALVIRIPVAIKYACSCSVLNYSNIMKIYFNSMGFFFFCLATQYLVNKLLYNFLVISPLRVFLLFVVSFVLLFLINKIVGIKKILT